MLFFLIFLHHTSFVYIHIWALTEVIHVFVGGLTQNDFILAAKINELNLHDLLRRKASD